jgi:high-affinity K+ transport system ATPase subunit B
MKPQCIEIMNVFEHVLLTKGSLRNFQIAEDIAIEKPPFCITMQNAATYSNN